MSRHKTLKVSTAVFESLMHQHGFVYITPPEDLPVTNPKEITMSVNTDFAFFPLTWGDLKAFAEKHHLPDNAEVHLFTDAEIEWPAKGLTLDPATLDTRAGTHPANNNALPARLYLHESAENAQTWEERACFVRPTSEDPALA